jgi:hypothetical protein
LDAYYLCSQTYELIYFVRYAQNPKWMYNEDCLREYTIGKISIFGVGVSISPRAMDTPFLAAPCLLSTFQDVLPCDKGFFDSLVRRLAA